jgi:hypothetical protein
MQHGLLVLFSSLPSFDFIPLAFLSSFLLGCPLFTFFSRWSSSPLSNFLPIPTFRLVAFVGPVDKYETFNPLALPRAMRRSGLARLRSSSRIRVSRAKYCETWLWQRKLTADLPCAS